MTELGTTLWDHARLIAVDDDPERALDTAVQ
jgi:hypothetical protein